MTQEEKDLEKFEAWYLNLFCLDKGYSIRVKELNSLYEDSIGKLRAELSRLKGDKGGGDAK